MTTPKKKNIICFVEMAPKQALDTCRNYFPESRYLLLRDVKNKTTDKTKKLSVDFVEYVDFTSNVSITKALLPYVDDLQAITARGESAASRLAAVIPHVPYLRTPTPDSLRWATDKYEMRKRLKLYDAKITPKFTRVLNATKKERQRVIEKVGFPMVIKPVSLEESKLVTICYHEEELDKAARNIFRKLRSEYKKLNRLQEPTVMAESFMDGDMYSVDSYVDSRGTVWHCPLVRIRTGRDIGHGDFFNYTQTTPTVLKKETIANAHKTTETAIHALGLRSTTTHIELMKMDDEWKVIEVGPRIGGFRPLLYELSCDIDHSLNDVLIRVPKKPVVPKKCKGYATAMKWFVKKEGEIVEMKGIKKIESFESFHSITINKKIGDRAVFARNGGKSIFNVFLYNEDRSKLLADIRRIEQTVQIRVRNRRKQSKQEGVAVLSKATVVKKSVKKSVLSKNKTA